MLDKQPELEIENIRLSETVTLAKTHLNKAVLLNEENKEAIVSAKKELWENTSHSVSNLWSSEAFEALADLSQYSNPVTAKIAEFEETKAKILKLEKLIKSPYFARIDFKFDDETEFEQIYIGRTSLTDDDSSQIYVYDWRSPIASLFYRFVVGTAYYEAPAGKITGEINLKRQYEIENSILEYYFDADLQIIDEFLRKLLSQNTSSKMKTIVETIQKEQDIIIRDMENDLMMVQGTAGSGKTSVALHRAAYLMYQGLAGKLLANNIIIISPNSLFEQYISNVLPELGESNVASMVFEELIARVLKNRTIQSKNQFLENLMTSNKHRDIIKKSIEFKTSPQFLEILNQFVYDLPEKFIEFEDVYFKNECIITKDELKSKVIAKRDAPLGMRLKQLHHFIMDLAYSKKKRLMKNERFKLKKDIQNFTHINILSIYKKLFSNKQYFLNLDKNINISRIIEFTNCNLNDDFLHYDDTIALTYLTLKIYPNNEYRGIKQVVIDEAQDYYPLQYEIFNLLFPKSKFTVLGDMNQTLEKQEDLSLFTQIEKILHKKKSSLISMDKSFRCTNEILNFSLKFLDSTEQIKSFNRQGEIPKIYQAPDRQSLESMIISEIKACEEKGYKSIGLICKNEKNCVSLFESLKHKIPLKLITINSNSDTKGVFLIPVYMSKGLEFDAVLICDASSLNYSTQEDKRLLYISSTRALHRLNVFGEGELSNLLI